MKKHLLKLSDEELGFLAAAAGFAIERLKKKPTALFAQQLATYTYKQSPGEFMNPCHTVHKRLRALVNKAKK